MKNMMLIFSVMLLLTACDNTSGLSDEEYARYKELGAPKLIYSCTYKPRPLFLLNEAEIHACRKNKEFKDQHECENKDSRELVTTVSYSAGIGTEATYNRLLTDVKNECDGQFKVIESEK